MKGLESEVYAHNMSAAGFVERWNAKAMESADCFDRFFSAWIALVIEARRHLAAEELADPDTDRKAVIRYFGMHVDAVTAVLLKLPEVTAWLAARRGTATKEAILDVYQYSRPHLRRDFDELALVWSGGMDHKPGWIATKTGEMINHIRNNMFHGLKGPDDAADRELLERVNPILLGMLDAR